MLGLAAVLAHCGGGAPAVAVEPGAGTAEHLAAGAPATMSPEITPGDVHGIQVVPRTAGGGQCAPGSVWVGTVRGRVLDLAGAPLGAEQVSLCGAFCIGGTTRSDGRFTLHADGCFPRTEPYPHAVAFDFHGLGYHADVTVDLNLGDLDDLDAVEVPALSVPSMLASPSVPVPHEGEPEQKLTLPDGFSLGVAAGSLTLPFGALERVSAARITGANLPPVDAHGEMPVALFALTPAEATFAAPAPLVLPNDQQLDPDTLVEIVMLGGPSTTRFAPVGALGVVDQGRVSADGLTVLANHGIPFLGWVGYRARAR